MSARLARLARVAAAAGAATAMLALGAGPAQAAAVSRAGGTGSAATMLFQTVPAVGDVGVDLDGVVYRTDARGFVAIPTTSGTHHIRIVGPRSAPPGTTVRFSRWSDGISLPSRHIIVPAGAHAEEAGLVVSRPISVRFIAERGRLLPLTRIAQISLTNGVGQRFTFRPARPPRMLAANRVVRGAAGLKAVPFVYSVRSVIIDGSNVVFNGSQKFSVPQRPSPWTIKVLLFPLRVQVRDALFKFAVGDAVRLTFPNGASRSVKLGPGHAVTVTGLPRGNYVLSSQGPGLGFSTPVALSTAQSATLLMLSWADVLIVAGFAMAFVVGLPLAGGRIVRRPGGAPAGVAPRPRRRAAHQP